MMITAKELREYLLCIQELAIIEREECEKWSGSYYRMKGIIDIVNNILGVEYEC